MLPSHWQGSGKMPEQCRTPGHGGQVPGVFTSVAMNSPLQKLRCPRPTQSPREAEPEKRDVRQSHSTAQHAGTALPQLQPPSQARALLLPQPCPRASPPPSAAPHAERPAAAPRGSTSSGCQHRPSRASNPAFTSRGSATARKNESSFKHGLSYKVPDEPLQETQIRLSPVNALPCAGTAISPGTSSSTSRAGQRSGPEHSMNAREAPDPPAWR